MDKRGKIINIEKFLIKKEIIKSKKSLQSTLLKRQKEITQKQEDK